MTEKETHIDQQQMDPMDLLKQLKQEDPEQFQRIVEEIIQTYQQLDDNHKNQQSKEGTSL